MELTENDYLHLMKTYNNLTDYNNNQKRQGIHDYSLMNALLKKTDEVNLHSNFIYSMINPNGSHYCGNKFLEFFLESIRESGFINLDRAQVHKEKGKIDLLIEDGEKVIIIENKLRAPDQQHQISRYIQYAIENYLEGDKENLKDKIHIVYLSEYKLIPSAHKESTIGFDKFKVTPKTLIWKNEKVTLCNEQILDLVDGTEFIFNRVKHSDKLYHWVKKSKEYLTHKPNSEMLIYAFEEYRLILERLKNNNWRNVMSLDEYTIEIRDEEKQKDMYAFMCEANEKLNDYLAEKLYKEIIDIFPERTELKLEDTTFREFTPENCKKWFKEKGTSKNYKNIGFVFNENYFFGLGEKYFSYGLCVDGWEKGKGAKINRKNLQTNKEVNLFSLIEKLKIYRQKIST